MDYEKHFQTFLDCWRELPRTNHPLLPSRSDCSPKNMGFLLANVALFKYEGPFNLNMVYAGTEIERLSAEEQLLHNYYTQITDDKTREILHAFHDSLFSVPCGAYVSDAVTTKTGNTYVFETMQFPLSDDDGNVCYLMAYSHGRRPIEAAGPRITGDRTIGNIRDFHFIDLGAGAPTRTIVNFERKP